MVSASMVFVQALMLSCVPAAVAKPGSLMSWIGSKVTPDAAEPVYAGDLVREGGGITLKSCGGENDVMQVSEARIDNSTLLMHIAGEMTKTVSGGNITAKITFATPKNLTAKQRWARLGVRLASIGRGMNTVKSLCEHVQQPDQQNATCPIAKGPSKLALSFGRMPSVIAAGDYDMEIHAVSDIGEQVLCMKGRLHVAFGPQGHVLRKLDGHSMVADGAWQNALGLGTFVLLLVQGLF